VRQVDHQRQCGRMAERWGNEAFARPEPFAPIIDAARLHDEGWRGWEEAPEVNADGRPVDFPELDRAVHVRLYREGVARALERGPRVGLLVSMHGQGLYEARLGLDGPAPPRSSRREVVRRWLEEQDAVQRRARREIGGPAAERDAWAWAGYRLLQAWDLLSLYLLWRDLPRARGGTIPSVPREVGDPGVDIRVEPIGPSACTLDPFPFPGDEVDLPVRARMIPDRVYPSNDDLRAALAESEWITLELTVRRP
jgi:Protein of unknown function (DUF3891)